MENQIEVSKRNDLSFSDIIKKHSLRNKQAEALPLLAFDVDKEIAVKELGISGSTYDSWIEDPAFLAALTEYKLNIQDYHEYKLNQAGVLAWDRIMEVLTEEEGEGMSDKDRIALLNLKKDTAKFVVSQLKIKADESKSQIDLNARSELYVTDSSADIIARKLHQLQEGTRLPIVDGEYRPVDDGNMNDDIVPKIEEKSIAILEGMSYGRLDEEDGKIKCHMCGELFADLVSHVLDTHGVDIYGYRRMYGLDEAILTKAPAR